jgi:predicted transglutaminase-like cysteine proteinase
MADDDIEVMAFTPATASPEPATAIVSIDRGIDTAAPRGDDLASYGFLRKAQRIPFGHAAAVPVGYYELCVGHPDECRASHGWMGQWSYQFGMHLDAARMKQLIAVNASVNHSIRQRTDRALYHVTDRWVVNPKAGDCEDYALTKKARLIADGWPSSALLVALAKTRAGQDHAVLVVRTDRGDLVLDSLRSTIRGWTPSLYRWRSVQSPTDTWAWFTIDKAPKPVVASALGEPSLRRDLSTAVVVFE